MYPDYQCQKNLEATSYDVHIWLVVSTHLKNMSQIGFIFPKVRVENNKYLKPPRRYPFCPSPASQPRPFCCLLAVMRQFFSSSLWNFCGTPKVLFWDRGAPGFVEAMHFAYKNKFEIYIYNIYIINRYVYCRCLSELNKYVYYIKLI